MSESLVFFWILLLLPHPSVSQLLNGFLSTGFRGGASAASMTLDGAAEIQSNGILRLTNDTSRIQGHAFHSSPFRFKPSPNGTVSSFSTCFAFAAVPEYPKLGGHGLAFAASRTPSRPGALPSQYLGLLNGATNGNRSNHVFAVEFDTVRDFEFADINDNHVGVDLNSLLSNASAGAAYYPAATRPPAPPLPISLNGGAPILAWVDYDSSEKRVNVTLSPTSVKPSIPILSFRADLSEVFEEFMYVGFSASTGLLASSHYILGWSFNLTGPAAPLDLSSLPKLPAAKRHRSKTLIAAVSALTAVLLVLVSAGAVFYVVRRIKNRDVIESWELDIGPHRFSYKELKKATRGFRDKELLGFGGFGRVYKGTLPNESRTQVAVKRISHESKQGLPEFLSEIGSVGRLRHRNLVQLLGWCRRRGDLLLVYDYMPNGSLDKLLFDEPERVLTWEQRFRILRGVASGLLYLHEEWEQTVIHRDVKAGNVLLDAEWNGRLGDFGLAKLYEHGANPGTTRVVGTLGYLAPELTRFGKPTASSDVFAFGALLLEVVCGRRPIEPKALPEELVLVDWVWDKWKAGAALAVVDPRLEGRFEEAEAVAALKLGLMCSNNGPAARPTMRQVVRYLEGEARLPAEVPAPDSDDGGKEGNGGGGCDGGLDFVHSYPMTSSFMEKGTTWSSGGDDVEAVSTSSFYLSGGNDGR